MPARPTLLLLLVAALPRCHPFSSPRSNLRVKGGRSTPAPRQMAIQEHHDDNGSVQLAIDSFISTLQTSLDEGSFESFTLKGPSAPRKRRNKKATSDAAGVQLEQQQEKLRGKYKSITGRLVLLQDKRKKKRGRGQRDASKAGGDADRLHVQATIKYHLATDLAKNWQVSPNLKSSEQSEVELGLRQLFVTATGNDVDEQSGAPLSEWGARNINGDLGILGGELATRAAVYTLRLQPRHKASFVVSKQKPTQHDGDASQRSDGPSQLSHDRAKNVPLLPSSEFFQKLGVTNAAGKPANGMASKLRQCQKFVEIVGGLVDGASGHWSSASPAAVRVVDMGCGRGYLTFALHAHLSARFGAAEDGPRSVETRGIDRRPKLIAEVNGIARELGGAFDTLAFSEGAIGDARAGLFGDERPPSETANSLDVLIALHACDRATDEALWFAIGRGADIIVTAPCCQHELRPQIDRHAADNPDHPLSAVLRHAIYRERATETATDAVRALLLEIAGYQVQVMEFIGGEHTAKNVMLTATRTQARRSAEEQEEWRRERRRRLVELAQLYGLRRQRLATLMGESLAADGGDGVRTTAARPLSGMAPL